MSPEVDDPLEDKGWPRNQWHPVYDSVTAWLDNEAGQPTGPTPKRRKRTRRGVKR